MNDANEEKRRADGARYVTRSDNEFRVLYTALYHYPDTGSRKIALEIAKRLRDAPKDADVVFEVPGLDEIAVRALEVCQAMNGPTRPFPEEGSPGFNLLMALRKHPNPEISGRAKEIKTREESDAMWRARDAAKGKSP